MPAADGSQPELKHRIFAAAGASVVSALLVNPLDVIKTRVQASSLVIERPVSSCLFTRSPVRWVRPASLADCQSKLPTSPVVCCVGAPSHAAQSGASQLHRQLLGQVPMSSCACALKVADLSPASLGTPERCLNANTPYRPVTAMGVLKDIVRKEGFPALWRGTDTAILASIPMIGVYMPLYDHLLQRYSPALGPYAPPVAGSVARTLAVLLVGPLELVRTRQQGSAAGARTAWGALRDTLRESKAAAAAAAASAGQGGSSLAASPCASSGMASVSGMPGGGAAAVASGAVSLGTLLRALPHLWTGVVATLARDVPFSAIYWGLVEPLRGGLLAHWGQQQTQQQVQQQQAQHHPKYQHTTGHQQLEQKQGPVHSAAQPHQQQHPHTSLSQQLHRDEQQQHHHNAQHSHHRPREQGPALLGPNNGVPASPAQRSDSTLTEAPAGPSGRAVFFANLIAGSTAGALAAVVTTPFDVVKTQLQLQTQDPSGRGGEHAEGGGQGGGGRRQRGVDVVRRVLRAEGPPGLFRGWGPRAVRTAPACAVVVTSYEVLKLLL